MAAVFQTGSRAEPKEKRRGRQRRQAEAEGNGEGWKIMGRKGDRREKEIKGRER